MRIDKKTIIIIFCLVVGLTGCQNKVTIESQLGDISKLRIVVPEDGYFEITQKEWEEHGFKFQSPEQIHLEYKGDPYPFWVNQEPDSREISIRFYSPKIQPGINLKENVFILSQKPSDYSSQVMPLNIIPVKNNSEMSSTGIFRDVYQNQSIYLPQVSGEDHWLWALMHPNQRFEQDLKLFPIPVDEVSIRCYFWVTSTSSRNSTQLVSVSINNHAPELFQVKGQEWQHIEIQMDASTLSKNNKFSLQQMVDAETLPNKIYLDRIEIEYSNPIGLNSQFQSFLILDDKPLNFTNSTPGTLVIMDKTDLPFDVYSIQSEGHFNFDSQPNATYNWIPDNKFLPVLAIQPMVAREITIPGESVNYLIIAPNNFHPALFPLIELRKDQDLNTMMVSPQQIYDTYHSGYPSIDSLKKFVHNINEINSGQLEYLLLVGDYSYEIVNYQEFINYVPSFFVNAGQMGQTISDFPFADLDEDFQPEFAVGRVPAETPQQVTDWVAKVIDYESFIPSKWNKLIAISDPSDPRFFESAQNFLLPFYDEYQTQIFNSPNSVTVQKTFTEPYTLLFYFGHGSIDLWGKDKILTSAMIADLPESSAAPFLISFSCLNGYFIHPDKSSLAEELLFNPDGGVVGMLAPTGQTTLENQEILIQYFQNKLQSLESSSVNELIFPQEGEASTEDLSLVEIWKTYIYFGDPAMKIP